jgi:hypothetical protein
MKKIKQTIVFCALVAIAIAAVQSVYAEVCGKHSSSQQEAYCFSCRTYGDCDIRYAYSDSGRTQLASVLCSCGTTTEGCKDGTTKLNEVYYSKRTCNCTTECESCTTASDGNADNVHETETSNTDCAGG